MFPHAQSETDQFAAHLVRKRALLREQGRDPERASFSFYHEGKRALYVICGSGTCEGRYSVGSGATLFRSVDLLQYMHPRDYGPDFDRFAGIKVYDNLSELFTGAYMEEYGQGYEKFRRRYMRFKYELPVAEILSRLMPREQVLQHSGWPKYGERVMRALEKHRPSVHIPIF